jgi:single-stranded-DNA-specific exonuclease
MIKKRWVISELAPQEWQNQFPELPPILKQLLWNRGLRTQEAIDEFLNPDYGSDLHNPFLFKDMEKAVERIFQAIEKKEKIAIYGDYDADGVTGSVILETTLRALGAEISEVHLPHREKEGYGLNKEVVQHLISLGSKIIITCDCGIANFEEVEIAHEKEVDVIITDHHHLPERIPPAYAILHPHLPDCGYPFRDLTGGAVAYKLAVGLLSKYRKLNPQKEIETGFEKWLLDLVAISTIADVGRLIGENRTLVKYGLIVLQKTRRLGLLKLYEVAGLKQNEIDTWAITYLITPRINAAGRLNHANTAYRLLISNDENEAKQLAEELSQTNQLRQQETDRVVLEAKEQIGDGNGKYLLAAFKKDWSVGVIGLAASKLSEEFARPVLVACQNENGYIIGSGRSINQFDIVEALERVKGLMIKFGGHPKAAGFALKDREHWEMLVNHLEEMAKEKLTGFDLRPAIYVDAKLSLNEINWDLWRIIETMEPFGEGNPRPKFLLEGLTVVDLERVGNDGKHLRLLVTDERHLPYKMIGFCFGDWCEYLKIGDKINVVFELGVNEWNGNQELQLKIVDLERVGDD